MIFRFKSDKTQGHRNRTIVREGVNGFQIPILALSYNRIRPHKSTLVILNN
jgi:hypothetical protein